jgi:ATP-binding cassette, subfamily A (ABC1), member 3
MSKGSLRCCGSPLYLKSKYGSGYSLVLTRKKRTNSQLDNIALNNHNLNNESDIDLTNKIIDLVEKTVPNSKLSSNINTEIGFVLPTEETSKFPELFDKIDKMKDELKILNVGISVTTVEEVFLK